jgi:hypothetical protein
MTPHTHTHTHPKVVALAADTRCPALCGAQRGCKPYTPSEDIHTRRFPLSLAKAVPALQRIRGPSRDYCSWEQVYCTSSRARIYRYNEGLTGTLPDLNAGLSASQVQVDVIGLSSNTKIHGALPPSWGALPLLEWLYLEGTGVSSTLPPQWRCMGETRKPLLDNANLTGTIPQLSSNVTHLSVASMGNTQVTGCLPMAWMCERNLNMSDVGFTPSAVDRCPKAADICLSHRRSSPLK